MSMSEVIVLYVLRRTCVHKTSRKKELRLFKEMSAFSENVLPLLPSCNGVPYGPYVRTYYGDEVGE